VNTAAQEAVEAVSILIFLRSRLDDLKIQKCLGSACVPVEVIVPSVSIFPLILMILPA
jgi:hypothetical protein